MVAGWPVATAAGFSDNNKKVIADIRKGGRVFVRSQLFELQVFQNITIMYFNLVISLSFPMSMVDRP